MLCKNKWALPSGAKEQIGPTGRSRAPGGRAHSFDRVGDFTYHIKKSKKSDLNLERYAYFTIFSPRAFYIDFFLISRICKL